MLFMFSSGWVQSNSGLVRSCLGYKIQQLESSCDYMVLFQGHSLYGCHLQGFFSSWDITHVTSGCHLSYHCVYPGSEVRPWPRGPVRWSTAVRLVPRWLRPLRIEALTPAALSFLQRTSSKLPITPTPPPPPPHPFPTSLAPWPWHKLKKLTVLWIHMAGLL